MRKHRLAECLLVDVIGMAWEDVHAEACRWEHVMSEAVERRLLELLGHPTVSPYGNPIPGLDELGDQPSGSATNASDDHLVTLDVVGRSEPHRVVVRRIGEPVQTDATLMASLRRAGVTPGRGRQGDASRPAGCSWAPAWSTPSSTSRPPATSSWPTASAPESDWWRSSVVAARCRLDRCRRRAAAPVVRCRPGRRPRGAGVRRRARARRGQRPAEPAAQASASLPDGRDVVVMCRSGHRSAIAARALATDGRTATNLAGGIIAWSAAGEPVLPESVEGVAAPTAHCWRSDSSVPLGFCSANVAQPGARVPADRLPCTHHE